MVPEIYAHNVELTPRLQQYVEKKTSRLDRYMPNIAELRVDLTAQNARNASERQIAQVTVRDQRGMILRAEERNSDMFAAVDAVMDKTYRQIDRYRGKKRDRRRKGNKEFDESVFLEPLPIEDDQEALEEEVGSIVRRKRFVVQPMTPEEAIDQMELLGHDFFLFLDMENDSVNLVYKRRGGNYGLLQPAYD
ncbi:MAG: ribosome-associated translation inhibitor RaiA [Anaerolineae bacterium]|nr:ribosome-associated translation inhibitor RaiA [Anaerolineae bacterium]MCO5189105.1 ribosome-associated translation inhibitor RaiA [Anaerolineae bacterium]MCO5193238.1 ribosome-associated translation inhibitor RaiA [Anaerolineae bacterium]MCO5198183.1 ribosome-associated translation inhibitor RaiA [Anaerolineae bacterium]MCO5205489.1 ribosome-associated translation inhibitor RaiA [Anaerolineae bacterium]